MIFYKPPVWWKPQESHEIESFAPRIPFDDARRPYSGHRTGIGALLQLAAECPPGAPLAALLPLYLGNPFEPALQLRTGALDHAFAGLCPGISELLRGRPARRRP